MKSIRIHRLKYILIGIIILVVVANFIHQVFFPQTRNYVFRGETMGTSYTIKIFGSPLSRRKMHVLHDEIKELLENLNSKMSTYNRDSEISRFNRIQTTNVFAVSHHMAKVMRCALSIASLTDGAFDPTVMPLVLLWGFGIDGGHDIVPYGLDVKNQLKNVGYQNIEISGLGALSKKFSEVKVDLSAIAKGYAVDQVASHLISNQCYNVVVEVGGEVSVMGTPLGKDSWIIAIDSPEKNLLHGEKFVKAVSLRNKCIATSGDYRIFFENADRVFPHIIDPRTGYPISNGVTSAAVIAPSCMTADALATAMMVLGPKVGLKIIEEYIGAEALFIVRYADGSLFQQASSQFPEILDFSLKSTFSPDDLLEIN